MPLIKKTDVVKDSIDHTKEKGPFHTIIKNTKNFLNRNLKFLSKKRKNKGVNEEIQTNQEKLPENFNIGDIILVQPNENSLIFEGEIIPGSVTEGLVNIKYKDEKGNIQIIYNIDKRKLKKIREEYKLSNGDYSIGKNVKVNSGKGVVLGKIIDKYYVEDCGNNYRVEIINKPNHIIDLEEGDLDELNKPGNKIKDQE